MSSGNALPLWLSSIEVALCCKKLMVGFGALKLLGSSLFSEQTQDAF